MEEQEKHIAMWSVDSRRFTFIKLTTMHFGSGVQ